MRRLTIQATVPTLTPPSVTPSPYEPLLTGPPLCVVAGCGGSQRSPLSTLVSRSTQSEPPRRRTSATPPPLPTPLPRYPPDSPPLTCALFLLSSPADLSSDPLCTSALSASHWSSLLSLLRYLSLSLPLLTTPFLVQHGLRDLITSPHGTRHLLHCTSHLSAFDKRLVVHSRSWHDLLHEAEWEKVVEMSVEWMMQRTEHMKQTVSLD